MTIGRRAPAWGWAKDRKYAVIIDAGSSGSRVQVYSWLDSDAARSRSGADPSRLPRVEKGTESGDGWMKKIKPGISTFGDDPEHVGKEHMKKLLKHAKTVVPQSQYAQTPVYLLATAGMRLLPETDQRAVMAAACAYTKEHSEFVVGDCNDHFQVISGETEGLFGWSAINYLLGGFDEPHDGLHHTYGFLDMGGASAQIAFAPNPVEAEKHADDLTLLRLRSLSGEAREWRVFVTTWLGFGANEARRRYVASLESLSSSNKYIDPCLPKDFSETVDGKQLEGTGSLQQCLTLMEPLLDKNTPCPDPPCLFAGVHVPGIDFDINHFIGISEYYYSAQDIFGLGGAYDYHTLSNAVAEHCSRSWTGILDDLEHKKFPEGVKQGKLESVCFKAAWIMSVLHDGIGIPRVGKERIGESAHNGTEELREGARKAGFDGAFNSAESLEGTEVSWTLGKAVLLASADVPSTSVLPVGFGPNLQPELFKSIGDNGVVEFPDGFGSSRYASAGGSIFWQALFVLFAALLLVGFALLRMRKLPLPGALPSLRRFAPSSSTPVGRVWRTAANWAHYSLRALFGAAHRRRKIMGARGETSYEYDSLSTTDNGNGTGSDGHGHDADVEIELGDTTANALPISRTQSSMRLSRRSSDV